MIHASRRMSSARRTASPPTLPRSRWTISAPPVDSTFAASPGRTTSSAAASTVPTSATVSVTLSALRLKTALWTSRTADRNRLVKARLAMIDEATDWITGRAAIRSRSRFEHHLVGDPLRDQRAHAVIAKCGGGAVGELIRVHGRPAHIAGDQGEHQRDRGQHDQRPDCDGSGARGHTRTSSPPRGRDLVSATEPRWRGAPLLDSESQTGRTQLRLQQCRLA